LSIVFAVTYYLFSLQQQAPVIELVDYSQAPQQGSQEQSQQNTNLSNSATQTSLATDSNKKVLATNLKQLENLTNNSNKATHLKDNPQEVDQLITGLDAQLKSAGFEPPEIETQANNQQPSKQTLQQYTQKSAAVRQKLLQLKAELTPVKSN
jgi:hypothetical protein